MEEHGTQPDIDAVEQARSDLETAESSDDATRLEVLEDVRRKLESELEAGVENGSSRH